MVSLRQGRCQSCQAVATSVPTLDVLSQAAIYWEANKHCHLVVQERGI